MLVRLRAGDDEVGGGVVGGGGGAAVSDAAGARRSFFSCCYSSLCSVISLVCANLCANSSLSEGRRKKDSRRSFVDLFFDCLIDDAIFPPTLI